MEKNKGIIKQYEEVKDTSIIGLIICFFFGHRKVYGNYSDGKSYWSFKCSRCSAVGNPVETVVK